ncbi:FusB/FusC family EF-G-binding protein [Brevibacillus choshinensis]|uniref:FusB/FusC family EF-G-binding protein n=1 Tax=Brevibacillus choshinensis TaxID=54911 RepID=A0ABX7FLY7_BRECH|nr:FusB/FusC family EF-G-binding protein [Brevibacillus choshinensis]QRG66699.1 FusB/FusC family EF-G-binding protein [Brevibacillus choshinensis]
MNPFLKSYQYNYIKAQTKILLNGLSASSDASVHRARKDIAKENVAGLFPALSEEQKQLLYPIADISENADVKRYLSELAPYVIPFPAITDQTLKKLFPKAKKLKAPSVNDLNLQEHSYVSWQDDGTQKKFLIAEYQGKLVGFQGAFTPMNQKGMCAICNRFEEVGMFISEIKSSGDGSYLKRGNYICQDSRTCNQNIISLEKLDDFVEMMRQ